MRRHHLIFAIAVLVLPLTGGCYKDLGNYDYKTLDELVIDTAGTGIKDSYAVYRYDTLRLAPNIYFNDVLVDPEHPQFDNLDFTWSIFYAAVGNFNFTRDTLSKSVILNAPIGKPSGHWIVHLSAKNLDTGVESYFRVNVQIDETISDGWMVQYETVDGNTDVGLIVDDYSKAGVSKDRVFIDLYKSTNGRHLSGKPTAIRHSCASLLSGEILIASENEFVGVDKISFEPIYPFESLFWTPPAVQKVTAVSDNNARMETVINDNRIHTADFRMAGTARTNYFGDAAPGETGKLAPWIAQFPSGDFNAVVYDQDNGCFLVLPYGGVSLQPFAGQDMELCAFDVNNVGMEMLASDYGRQCYEYSVMKKGDTYALLVSDLQNSGLSGDQVGIGYYDMSTFPGISSFNSITGSVSGEYIYYGTDDGVCIFKYNSGSPAYSSWKAPQGEKVTCVRVQKLSYAPLYNNIMPNPCQVLYIATWDESAAVGKVYEYMINPANGDLDMGSERVRTGFGKITDMLYKWSM